MADLRIITSTRTPEDIDNAIAALRLRVQLLTKRQAQLTKAGKQGADIDIACSQAQINALEWARGKITQLL